MNVHDWLKDRTIFEAVAGSHSYGLNTPASDQDFVGVCIPPNSYLFGVDKFEFADKFQDENGEKVDKTIFDFRKVISLIADNNPNVISMLFYPERCILKTSSWWNRIIENRDLFLSKKARYSFQGYAYSQLKRIKTHKSYMNQSVPKPNRADFGLPEDSIFPVTQVENIAKLSEVYIKPDFSDEFLSEVTSINDTYLVKLFRKFIEDPFVCDTAIREYKKGQTEHLRSLETISSNFLKDEYRDMAGKEMRYLSAYKNWRRYEDWLADRNPKRKAIEAKCGYDAKHATMLLLLSRQAVEILKHGILHVDRTNIDRNELLDIKLGNVHFDYVLSEAQKCDVEMDQLYKTSTLRYEADLPKIKEIMMEILVESFSNEIANS